jgi:murein DD-endopeptidase MepM/ murein hydrolase activator NlpD
VEGEIGTLQAEVAELELRLASERRRLQRLDAEIADKTRTLQRAGRELSLARRHLSRRLVDIYTSEEPDLVSVALDAHSLDDLIDVLETRETVLASDGALVGEIERLRTRVERERTRARSLREQQARLTASVEQRTSERRETLAGLVTRRDALAQLRSQRQRSLAAVRVERKDWEAQAAALAAASAQVASVVAAPVAAAPVVAPPPAASGGWFVWPVQGAVVSPYGQRWGRLHSGIDIAAPAGTPMAASASGTVVYSGSMSGYGLIVVIQHAGGISTAYAHNSSNHVSVGHAVAQGQTIASVGCTGHCFGDHVHFEVRVGGSPVDPMGYL